MTLTRSNYYPTFSVYWFAEWPFGLFVAICVEVLDAKPLVLLIDVADDLLMSHLCLELHTLIAVHAVHLTARFHEPSDSSTHLLDLDGLGRGCSLCHTVYIGRFRLNVRVDRPLLPKLRELFVRRSSTWLEPWPPSCRGHPYQGAIQGRDAPALRMDLRFR